MPIATLPFFIRRDAARNTWDILNATVNAIERTSAVTEQWLVGLNFYFVSTETLREAIVMRAIAISHRTYLESA